MRNVKEGKNKTEQREGSRREGHFNPFCLVSNRLWHKSKRRPQSDNNRCGGLRFDIICVCGINFSLLALRLCLRSNRSRLLMFEIFLATLFALYESGILYMVFISWLLLSVSLCLLQNMCCGGSYADAHNGVAVSWGYGNKTSVSVGSDRRPRISVHLRD